MKARRAVYFLAGGGASRGRVSLAAAEDGPARGEGAVQSGQPIAKIMQNTEQQLFKKAIEAASRAYAPYSKFRVGAALVALDGTVFCGCNVEIISYGLTVCAERNAVFAAVAAGHRDFSKVVVVADTVEPPSPCGACRQVLAEFNPDIEVVLANFHGKVERFRLSELLPRATKGILDRE